MMFLDQLLLKQDADKKLMINAIIGSILESLSTSDNEKINNGVSKPAHL